MNGQSERDGAILAQFRAWKRAWEQANQSGLSEEERAAACDVMLDRLVALAKIPAAGARGLALNTTVAVIVVACDRFASALVPGPILSRQTHTA